MQAFVSGSGADLATSTWECKDFEDHWEFCCVLRDCSGAIDLHVGAAAFLQEPQFAYGLCLDSNSAGMFLLRSDGHIVGNAVGEVHICSWLWKRHPFSE